MRTRNLRSIDHTQTSSPSVPPRPEEAPRPKPDFIVTPESYRLLADQDPIRARAEMVYKLHETCSSRIYGFLRKSMPADAAEDLTQETFLRLLQHKNLERKSISISYLFRVAQNLLRRRFNVAARGRLVLETVIRHDTQRFKKPTETNSAPVIEAGPLNEALSQLSPQEQNTIRMIVCEGRSYLEAAHALDVPVSTVNNWKHRALTKLRGIIDAADDEQTEHAFSPSPNSRAARGTRSTQDECSKKTPGSLGRVEHNRADQLSPPEGSRVAG